MSAALLATVATSLVGCSAEDGMMVDDETTQAAREEILNGTATQKRGVVELMGCTGVMIGPRHVLTTAGCLDDHLRGKEGFMPMTVNYFDPALEPRDKRPITATNERVFVRLKSTFAGDGDTPSDIAVVERQGGRWIGTENSDYQRLSLGSCADTTLYGRGFISRSGRGGGELYKMPVDVADCFDHYFIHREGTTATCAGDIGGPHIMKVQVGDDEWDVVTGLLSNFEKDSGSDFCTKNGGKQRSVRINSDKINFIESVVGTCDQFTADDGHKYKRCW